MLRFDILLPSLPKQSDNYIFASVIRMIISRVPVPVVCLVMGVPYCEYFKCMR